jgi:cobalt/nickel transport protein
MSKKEIIAGLIIALIVAFFLSPLASSLPDGLERVAKDQGFIEAGDRVSQGIAPAPDYVFPGIKNKKLAVSLSGVLGTVIIFGIGCSVAYLLKRRKD